MKTYERLSRKYWELRENVGEERADRWWRKVQLANDMPKDKRPLDPDNTEQMARHELNKAVVKRAGL